MTESELIPVYDASDATEALMFRNMLEEAGIPVVEREMESDWLEGVKLDDLHSQLMVRAEDAEQASALVAAFQSEADTGELSAEMNDAILTNEDMIAVNVEVDNMESDSSEC